MKARFLVLIFAISTFSHLVCMEQQSVQKWDGAQYNTHSDMQFNSAMQLLPEVQENDAILDLGCGTGRVSVELAKRVPKGTVHAVDASDSQIAEARKLWRHQKNLTFAIVDGQDLPFKNRFACIVSFHALHWMQNQQAVLNGCFKSLKPGGHLTCYTSARNTENFLKAAFNLLVKNEKWAALRGINTDEQIKWLDKATASTMLKKSGFEEISVEEHNLSHKFTPQEFIGFIRSLIGGYRDFAKLAATQQEIVPDLTSELVDAYKTVLPPDNDGKLLYAVRGLLIKARKPQAPDMTNYPF